MSAFGKFLKQNFAPERLYRLLTEVPMKRKILFDIFVDKGLKFRFLLLKLNIARFNHSYERLWKVS